MAVSEGEEVLALELKAAGIPFVREHRFHPPRRWRFDFALCRDKLCRDFSVNEMRIAIEVEGGHWSGGHKRGAAADSDCEKANQAILDGWRVLRFTTGMVLRGEAMPVIREVWVGAQEADQGPRSERPSG